MRIITGEFKNRAIVAPKNNHSGAMTEMVRESLFNILGDEIIGARFGDLFAGSGVVGLEALSRGADRVTWIESNRQNIKRMKQNLAKLQVPKDRGRVWQNDVFRMPESESEWAEWDIVFMDPPDMIKEYFLDALISRGLLKPSTLIIIKRSPERGPAPKSKVLSLLDQRKYHKAILYFFS